MREFVFLFVFVGIQCYYVSAWTILEDNGYCENAHDRQRGFCTSIANCTVFRKALLKYKQPTLKEKEKLEMYDCGATSSNGRKVCCPESEINLSDKSDKSILPDTTCGSSVSTRITGGSQTNIFEFPWMALLLYDTAKGLNNLCGGSIITNQYILTAAHCIVEIPSTSKLVGVKLGVDNLELEKECNMEPTFRDCIENVQKMDILVTYVHPYYNRKTIQNDIALIKVRSRIDFSTASVKPICLPSKQNNQAKTMIVSGWGMNSKGYDSGKLLKGEVPIVDNKRCSRLYKSIITITTNQICAGGYNETDACRGDSGGPLMYKGDGDRYIQIGIVSFGPSQCGTRDKPGVYTKIEPYMSWILENIKK